MGFSLPTPKNLLILLLLLHFVSAQQKIDNLNQEGIGCVDPEGFLDCYDAQLTQLTSCGKVANSTCSDTNTHLQTCLAGCEGAHLASKVGCWLQSCWNQVYSCEYQRTAAEYVKGMDLVQSTVNIPFYPAPDGDLPGGCSCNVGHVYGNFSEAGRNHCMPAAETGNRNVLAECTCCQASYAISNVLNVCPKSDLSLFAFDQNLDRTQKTVGERTPDNCAVLEASGSAEYCANTYGVTEFAGDKVYNPLNLPSGIPGTEALSNLPGTAFTTFTSVLTLTLDPGFSTTITPVSFDKNDAGKTSSASSTAKTAGPEDQTTASNSGTGVSTAVSSPTPTNAGISLSSNVLMACIGIFAVVFCMQ